MRLVNLAANLATERGAESINEEASHQFGSQAGGEGSRKNAIVRQETAFGGGRSGPKRHPTLSELKRILAAHGKFRGILGLLGRD